MTYSRGLDGGSGGLGSGRHCVRLGSRRAAKALGEGKGNVGHKRASQFTVRVALFGKVRWLPVRKLRGQAKETSALGVLIHLRPCYDQR